MMFPKGLKGNRYCSQMARATEPDSQYKLVFTLFIIGYLDVSGTQQICSLVKGLIEAAQFWEVGAGRGAIQWGNVH